MSVRPQANTGTRTSRLDSDVAKTRLYSLSAVQEHLPARWCGVQVRWSPVIEGDAPQRSIPEMTPRMGYTNVPSLHLFGVPIQDLQPRRGKPTNPIAWFGASSSVATAVTFDWRPVSHLNVKATSE